MSNLSILTSWLSVIERNKCFIVSNKTVDDISEVELSAWLRSHCLRIEKGKEYSKIVEEA